MLKMVAKDYFQGFRWENIKKRNCIWPWIYIYGIPIWSGFSKRDIDIRELIMYLAIVIPLSFAVMDSSLHPIGIEKMKYLCPMDKPMRKKYIYQGFKFRLMVNAILGFIGISILVFLSEGRKYKVSCFMILMINQFMSGFCDMKEAQETGNNINGNKQIYFIVILLTDIFLGLVQLSILSDREPHYLQQIISWGVLLLVIVPIFLWNYKKNVKEDLEAAVTYEKRQQL